MFKVLSRKAYALLTADQKKEYDKALQEYIASFKTEHPQGVECEVQIIGLSNQPNSRKGSRSPVHAYTFITDNALVAEQIGERGVLLRPFQSADIVAKNCGFMNHTHMAIALLPFANKGTLKFTMSLRVKGEEYAPGKPYKTTSFAQENFEFIPSAAATRRISEVSFEAAKSGFMDLMAGSIGTNNTGAEAPEVSPAEDDVEV